MFYVVYVYVSFLSLFVLLIALFLDKRCQEMENKKDGKNERDIENLTQRHLVDKLHNHRLCAPPIQMNRNVPPCNKMAKKHIDAVLWLGISDRTIADEWKQELNYNIQGREIGLEKKTMQTTAKSHGKRMRKKNPIETLNESHALRTSYVCDFFVVSFVRSLARSFTLSHSPINC